MSQLEDYLLRQTENRNARADAESFADEMPWLTTEQRADLVRLYIRERFCLAERTAQLLEDGCQHVREQHSAAYEELRRRMCATVVILCGALSVSLSALLAVWNA